MPEVQRIVGAVGLVVWLAFMIWTERITITPIGMFLPASRSWAPLWSNLVDWVVSVHVILVCGFMILNPKPAWPGPGWIIVGMIFSAFIFAVYVPIRVFLTRRAFAVMNAHEELAQQRGLHFSESYESTKEGWEYPLRGYVDFGGKSWLALTALSMPRQNGVSQFVVYALPALPTDPTVSYDFRRASSGHFAECVESAKRAEGLSTGFRAGARIRDDELQVVTAPYDTVQAAERLVGFTRRLAHDLEAAGLVRLTSRGTRK